MNLYGYGIYACIISVVVGSKRHINYQYGMDRNLLTNFTVGGHGRGICYHRLLG